MVKKFLIAILVICLLCTISISSYAADEIVDPNEIWEETGENISAWEKLNIATLDDAFEKANNGDIQNLQKIFLILSNSSMTQMIYAKDYDTAQHYIELTNHLLDYMNSSEGSIYRGTISIESGAEFQRMEDNISKASEVKDGNTDDGNTDDGSDSGSSSGSQKTWKDYTLSDYQGNGSESIEYLWSILKNVSLANMSTEDKVLYVKYLEAIYDNRNLAEINTANEILSEVPNLYDQIWESYSDELDETEAESIIKGGTIYVNPLLNQGTSNAEEVTPDKIIGDADVFMNTGKNSGVATINQDNADTVFNSIYNILLAIGITVTVIWGLVIAIKLMFSSVEEKAEYKKLLWPYLIGCIVIYGSFAIWKLVIVIMNNTL